MTAIGLICLLGSATAAELTGAEIQELISGNSVYLELTASITGDAHHLVSSLSAYYRSSQ
jgi:hypothetical protein